PCSALVPYTTLFRSCSSNRRGRGVRDMHFNCSRIRILSFHLSEYLVNRRNITPIRFRRIRCRDIVKKRFLTTSNRVNTITKPLESPYQPCQCEHHRDRPHIKSKYVVEIVVDSSPPCVPLHLKALFRILLFARPP